MFLRYIAQHATSGYARNKFFMIFNIMSFLKFLDKKTDTTISRVLNQIKRAGFIQLRLLRNLRVWAPNKTSQTRANNPG